MQTSYTCVHSSFPKHAIQNPQIYYPKVKLLPADPFSRKKSDIFYEEIYSEGFNRFLTSFS